MNIYDSFALTAVLSIDAKDCLNNVKFLSE